MFVKLFYPAYHWSLCWTSTIQIGVWICSPNTNRMIYLKLVHLPSSQIIAFSCVGRGQVVVRLTWLFPLLVLASFFLTDRNDLWKYQERALNLLKKRGTLRDSRKKINRIHQRLRRGNLQFFFSDVLVVLVALPPCLVLIRLRLSWYDVWGLTCEGIRFLVGFLGRMFQDQFLFPNPKI